MLFHHLGATFPHRVAEWMLGAVLFTWGVVLLHDDHTFQLSEAYLGLAQLASEEVWGWGCLIVGAIRLIALFINGTWVPPTYHLRSATSFLSCLFWFSISLGMAASGAASTGLAVYPWLLITEAFCVYRTARDYRVAIITLKAAKGE